jgi:AcrR family transcriptional regulator
VQGHATSQEQFSKYWLSSFQASRPPRSPGRSRLVAPPEPRAAGPRLASRARDQLGWSSPGEGRWLPERSWSNRRRWVRGVQEPVALVFVPANDRDEPWVAVHPRVGDDPGNDPRAYRPTLTDAMSAVVDPARVDTPNFRVTLGHMEVRTPTRRPYKQVTRARAQRQTRDALLDAAQREFFAGRWEEVSLEAIAAGAGVTKQTLLRHFGSKDALLEQATERGFTEVRDQRFDMPSGDIAAAVDNLLEHYEQWGERAMRIGAVEGLGAVARLGRRARQLHYDWVDHAFGPALQQLGAKNRTRRRAALIALCDVHTWWLLSHDLGLPRAEVRATLIQAIEPLIAQEEEK